MKLETKNSNYCATIVKVHNLLDLENCDNVVGFPIFGYQAIVGKDTKIGQLGVLFTAETQLSEDFCKENNLFRKKELNKNSEKVGYFDENRRVKALKFRGHKSSALFMPIESLSYLNIDINQFKEGDTFDTINGVEICKKYVIKDYKNNRENKVRGQSKIFKRVEAKLFPEHLDSENFFRNTHKYKDNDYIYVTQKLHGCVSEDTIVDTLEYGEKTIKEVVEVIKDCHIKSFDTINNKIVYSKVDSVYKKLNSGEWYEIELEDGKTIKITSNNPVWLPQLKCYRKVEDLKTGDILLVD